MPGCCEGQAAAADAVLDFSFCMVKVKDQDAYVPVLWSCHAAILAPRAATLLDFARLLPPHRGR